MATFLKLENLASSFVKESFIRQAEAEANRVKEYDAAVKIQSWYRGLRTRHYLK